ncbi:extracellular sulfatase Sulf-2 isoform X1 [Arapaima gigas]
MGLLQLSRCAAVDNVDKAIPNRDSRGCDCDPLRQPGTPQWKEKELKSKTALLQLHSTPWNQSWSTHRSRAHRNEREQKNEDTGSRGSIVGPSPLKVTHRSLQTWKDQKVHTNQMEMLQMQVKDLQEVQDVLKQDQYSGCPCDRKWQDAERKQRHLREQKHKKKLRKLLKRLRNNDTCSMPGLTCFTHDNHHWQTAPFWTMGPFCACTSANNNTYWCLRTLNSTHNFLFCEFATGFLEYFDLIADPHQLVNAIGTLERHILNQLHIQLMELRTCRGQQQCNLGTGGNQQNSFEEYRQLHHYKRLKMKIPTSKSQ